MNSTHAAWLNLALALFAAILPVISNTPGVPSAVVSAALAANAVLHILLPDAPITQKDTPAHA